MLKKKILLFASAALLFAGCAKENIIPTETPDNNSQKGDITLSFSASQTGFGTKAVIGETTGEGTSKSTAINWQSNDKISVFDGAGANCEFRTKDFSTETPTSCTFEGTVTKLATDYTAVYPYTKGAIISEDVISGVTLPATQTAVAGSFDPSAALMAAKTVSGERELAFKNLVGYVKVTTDFNCKKIELCAASGEKLAGAGTITFTEGTPSFTLGDGAESTITLLPAGEGTTIAAGKTYYIAVPAGTLAAGWNISFTATNGNVYSRQGTKQIQFKTNTVINLGTIKLDDLIPYVTFTAENEQTFTFSIPEKFTSALGENEYFEYSVGGEWTRFTTTVENIKFGGTLGSLRLRGKSSKGTALDSDSGCSIIEFTTENSPVDCTGDIRTLIDYENYANANTTNARFRNLFFGNEELRTAPSLPATTLAEYCYYAMFSDCKALTTAPEELPATTLAEACYTQMFGGCTALTTAPTLLAETLARGCCDEMFGGCIALKTAPEELPATTLADGCYNKMFYGCKSLETAPELPAETLADGCYAEMFRDCIALKTVPELPAETLVGYCYAEMFRGCTNLTSVTMLATDVRADMCLQYWLNEAGTNNQGRAPTLTLYNEDVYKQIQEQINNNNEFHYLPYYWSIQYKYY